MNAKSENFLANHIFYQVEMALNSSSSVKEFFSHNLSEMQIDPRPLAKLQLDLKRPGSQKRKYFSDFLFFERNFAVGFLFLRPKINF